MTLKILGGEFRGRLLKAPKGDQTRPTKSLLRKAVFDILKPNIQEAVFLDLFAGSGAMGIEALSRGAKRAIFIDSHPQSIRCIQANLTLLNLTATVIQSDVMKALQKRRDLESDIIYVDPPYHRASVYLELIEWIDQHALLRQGGVLLIEAPYPSPLEQSPFLTSLKAQPPRRYGDSMLHLYNS